MKKLIIPLALCLLMLSACDLFFVSQKIVYQDEPRIEESQNIEEPELQEEALDLGEGHLRNAPAHAVCRRVHRQRRGC